MFAYGVALSYAVLHRIARAAGPFPWAAHLWPLGFEAFMASAALNALAEQRTRAHRPDWRQRVPWYPWSLTATTADGSILLNWFHPAIPLDPPPGWLVSLVYGLPPLAAVFAWHLFLQRLAHRRQQHPQQTEQDPARPGRLPAVRPLDLRQDPASADPRGTVRALLAHETPQSRVSAATVQQATGLSRLNAKLIEEAAEVIGVTVPCHRAMTDTLASELADVLEVVYALAAANGIARRDLEQVRQDKRDARGGFTRGTLWLDSDGPGGTP